MSGFLSAGILGADAVPDSVASRPEDNATNTGSEDVGIVFTTSQVWPDFQAEISSNHEPASDEELVITDTDDQEIGAVDISDKSGGDVVKFSGVDLSEDTTYNIYGSTSNSRTRGVLNDFSPPYESEDGNLSITDGYFNGPNDGGSAQAVKKIGNIDME